MVSHQNTISIISIFQERTGFVNANLKLQCASLSDDMFANAPSSLHLPISFNLETCNTLTYHIQKKQVFFDHMHHCQQLSTILSSSCSMERQCPDLLSPCDLDPVKRFVVCPTVPLSPFCQ